MNCIWKRKAIFTYRKLIPLAWTSFSLAILTGVVNTLEYASRIFGSESLGLEKIAASLLGLTVFLSLATLILAAILVHRSSRAAGLCPGCGYDLRASKNRCPECGREIEQAP